MMKHIRTACRRCLAMLQKKANDDSSAPITNADPLSAQNMPDYYFYRYDSRGQYQWINGRKG